MRTRVRGRRSGARDSRRVGFGRQSGGERAVDRALETIVASEAHDERRDHHDGSQNEAFAGKHPGGGGSIAGDDHW